MTYTPKPNRKVAKKAAKKVAKKPISKTVTTSQDKAKKLKLLVSYEDVCKAAKRLEGVANKTPVMTSRTLNKLTGAMIYLKCENYQRIGVFKFRGGYNALARFTAKQRKAGVIAFSSGNHA